MNYKELRIGNHVYINNRETEVSLSDIVDMSKCDKYELDDVVVPIFLSEALLLKIGFKVEFEVSPYRVFSYEGFLLKSNLEKTFNFYVGQQVVGKPIAYLHQLQNLFFLMTGHELLNGVGSLKTSGTGSLLSF